MSTHSARQQVLIETYWNVNTATTGNKYVYQNVLIETYWNVNIPGLRDMRENSGVLIETYWNVNVYCHKSGFCIYQY